MRLYHNLNVALCYNLAFVSKTKNFRQIGDFVDGFGNWYEGLSGDEWDSVLDDTSLQFDEVEEMINDKLDPIIEHIEAEYHQTDEEYQNHVKHERITTTYTVNKTQFEAQYGKDTYDYIYDVFGELRNLKHQERSKQWDQFNGDWSKFFGGSATGSSGQ